MKTKLFSIVLVILISSSVALAQSSRKSGPNIGFGLLGGINLQNLTGKDFWGDKLENKLVLGFHGGVNANIPLTLDFYLQPGLIFTVKGARNIIEMISDEIKTTTRLSYLELPLNLLYRPKLGDGNLLFGFGPYVAYGIFGNEKTTEGSLTDKQDVRFKNSVGASDPTTYAYYRALDAGANIFFGYEIPSGLFCQLNAQLGMLQVNPDYELLSEDKTSVKNTGFGLSVGYRF